MKNLCFDFPFFQWFITHIQRLYRRKESKLLSVDFFSNMKVCFLPWINKDKISPGILCRNQKAIHYFEINQDKIEWIQLSCNPNAIHLLEENQEKIFWPYLSGNPNAMHLLETNQDKIDWMYLSMNPNAIHLLEENQYKIDWYMISKNSSIFQWDYTFYQERMDVHREELTKAVFSSKRFETCIGIELE